MQKNLSIVVFSCVALVAAAQDRYIVAPNREAIPLGPNEGALQVAQQHGLTTPNSVQTVCGEGGTYGGDPGTINFGFANGDVCLQRLIAPVTGVIETVYFRSYLTNTIPDSSCTVRIFNSNWTAAHPEPAGIACMGYYRWPADPTAVSFASPYVDDPGVNPGFVPRTAGSFDPNGAEIWGLGGFTTTWHRAPDPNGYINSVVMMDLGAQPAVTAGQAFNVCIRTPSVVTPPPTDRSEMLSVVTDISASDFMKFYYRGRTVGDSATFGWWHREYTMNIWAVIRATSNEPPTVATVSQVHDTLGSFPVVVRATVFDCNFVNPADTGVVSATLQYSTDSGTSYSDAAMSNIVGQGWFGTIPALPVGSIVKYRVRATDNHGLVSTPTSVKTYRMVGLNRDGYFTTINAPYSFVDITGAGGGTQIPVSAFFNTSAPNDDGTAGPFTMGGVFTGLFGRSQQYAWIGVNGAICLSNSLTDTVRVGNGFSLYNVPTTAAPKNFIAPFWNDFIIGPGGNGSIWYKVSGTQFIVQWNHIGNFNSASDTLTTFEVILDRELFGSMTFLYQSVGNTTLPMDGVIALQDTPSDTSKYVYISRAGYPSATRAHDSYAIQLRPFFEQVGEEMPLRYSLSANYPNPFNPSTKIEFQIVHYGLVTLKVFDVLGREVATLVDGYQPAGAYSVEFTPTNLASGVYFYRLIAGTYTSTRKMVIIR